MLPSGDLLPACRMAFAIAKSAAHWVNRRTLRGELTAAPTHRHNRCATLQRHFDSLQRIRKTARCGFSQQNLGLRRQSTQLLRSRIADMDCAISLAPRANLQLERGLSYGPMAAYINKSPAALRSNVVTRKVNCGAVETSNSTGRLSAIWLVQLPECRQSVPLVIALHDRRQRAEQSVFFVIDTRGEE